MTFESPEIKQKKPEIMENEATVTLSTPEQPPEDISQIEAVKAEREQLRQKQLAEVKKQLGMPPDKPEEKNVVRENQEQRIEGTEKEDIEAFSHSLKRLSGDLDELSNTIARNKFPKVRFDSDQLARVGSAETIDQKAISQGLESLNASINKIRMPEDRRDMMELEPRNIRSVIDGIETVEGDLLMLKGVFEEAESGDYDNLAKETSRALGRIRTKKEDLHDAVGALQRIKGR